MSKKKAKIVGKAEKGNGKGVKGSTETEGQLERNEGTTNKPPGENRENEECSAAKGELHPFM